MCPRKVSWHVITGAAGAVSRPLSAVVANLVDDVLQPRSRTDIHVISRILVSPTDLITVSITRCIVGLIVLVKLLPAI
jgi:hypothetical protein